MKPMCANGHDDGFTLLETLVGLVLLAVATTMFAQSVSAASAQLSAADRLADASFLGAKLMAETDVQSPEVVKGLDAATRLNWRRSAVVVDYKSDDGSDPVLLVTVEIFRSMAEPPILQLHSAIITPVWP